MAEQTVESPWAWSRRLVRDSWRTIKTIYYANSLSWRALKSGALVFFGLFLWSSANLLLSYQPGWTGLFYVMAYGFVLIPWGPFQHVVVIPLSLRLRRRPDRWSRVGRRLPNISLVLFLVTVVVLGTFPPGAMAIDFRSTLEEGGVDVNPDLLCTKSTLESGATIHCHLTRAEGIDSVAVESGGEVVLVDEEPPYEFTIHEDQLEEVVGQKQFQVVLRDEAGDDIRRYTRTLAMIDEA